MRAVVFYSNTNQSRALAEYLASLTGWELFDLSCPAQAERAASVSFARAVLVFPVHCQRLPRPISDFLRVLDAKMLAVVATYGGMCHGGVLRKVQREYAAGQIVAAAYVPMQHAYLPADTKTDLAVLRDLAAKLTADAPLPVRVPRAYKNPLADFFPAWRSRVGVRMHLDPDLCTGCGKCERECSEGGVANGRFTNRCIRCMKCAAHCKAGAISHRNRLLMRLYLKKRQIEHAEVYL